MDAGPKFEVLGIVVGESSEIRKLHRELCKEVKERRIHVSKLKKSKKKALFRAFSRLASGRDIEFLSVHAGVLDISKRISAYSRMPRRKAVETVLVAIVRAVMKRLGWVDTVDLDSEFAYFERGLRRMVPSISYRGACAQLADLVAYVDAKGIWLEPIRKEDLRSLGVAIRGGFL